VNRRLCKLGVSLVLLLAGGAILNVAVAWGLAFRATEPAWSTKRIETIVASNTPWTLSKYSARGQRELYWSQGGPEEATVSHAWMSPYIDSVILYHNASRDAVRYVSRTDEVPNWGGLAIQNVSTSILEERDRAFGWPLAALWYGVMGCEDSAGVVEYQLDGGWLQRGSVKLVTYDFVVFQYAIVWPSFAVNTIVYAVLLSFGMSFHGRRDPR
jgi:hypothetical protein